MAAGKKTGGRAKGTPNRATASKAAAVAASGLSPLDYLLEVMRDKAEDGARRIDAAKAAAPYIHPKLQPVDDKGSAAQAIVAHVVFKGLNADG